MPRSRNSESKVADAFSEPPERQKRHEQRERRGAFLAAASLGLLSLLALAGVFLLVVQERSRLRLSAEYSVFQLASDLVQAYDRGETDIFDEVEGLAAFGIYTVRGLAIFRFGAAPADLDPSRTSESARFSGNTIDLTRLMGGAMMRLQPPLPDETMPRRRQMAMAQNAARYVHLVCDLADFGGGLRSLYAGGLLVVMALVMACALFIVLYRRLERYRDREAKNRELVALGSAARTLTHEIKNPLGVIKIQCAILKKQVAAEAIRGVGIIEAETDRLTQLASRVRDFLTAGDIRAESISVSDYLRELAERYGEKLSVAPTAPELRISGDRRRLDQIMDNLIANALESLPEGESEAIAIAAEAGRRGRTVVSVADRGVGISDEAADRIYDLFYTTKTSGSGIGLALARRYAETMGAQLRHENRKGGGTVFFLDCESAGAAALTAGDKNGKD